LLNNEQYQAMTQKFKSSHTESSSSQPSTQSSELQQWSEVMPQASKADITVPQLKSSLTIKQPTIQQQNTLAAEGRMYSTVLMDPACMIQPEDFLQTGRLSMIYVPNYIYVPL
jgi:hypothetical protein